MEPTTCFVCNWEGEEDDESINYKEILSAINTLEEKIRRIEAAGGKVDQHMFIMGEDNTTAGIALTNFFYRKCPYLCGRLLQLHQKIGWGRLSAPYINTKLMPADEPSRGKPVNKNKCAVCWKMLKSFFHEQINQISKFRKRMRGE